MNKPWQIELKAKYPELFPLRPKFNNPEELTNEPYCGFGCGEGWKDLLYALCEELKPYKVSGVSQIKEKYAGLRFYVNAAEPEAYKIIAKYETLSLTICETCGKPGSLREEGYYYTACDEHK